MRHELDPRPAGRELRSQSPLAGLLTAGSSSLLRAALKLCGNLDDAEDLVQQTCVTALEKADQFDTGRSLGPWLFGILVRHHRRTMRNATRRLLRRTWTERYSSSAEEIVSSLERDEVLWREVQRLPQRYREVVCLFFREGLDQHEIAERISRPTSTVSTRINRALARLRNGGTIERYLGRRRD